MSPRPMPEALRRWIARPPVAALAVALLVAAAPAWSEAPPDEAMPTDSEALAGGRTGVAIVDAPQAAADEAADSADDAAAEAADSADDAALEELLEVDRAFARHSEEHGMVAAFAEYLAEDALMLPNGGPPVQGREKILEIFSGGPPTELVWEPRGGLVADSGELGTTWGSYRATVSGPDGSETVGHGKYLNVWRKGPDGAWKVIVDMGNTNPPPAPETGSDGPS